MLGTLSGNVFFLLYVSDGGSRWLGGYDSKKELNPLIIMVRVYALNNAFNFGIVHEDRSFFTRTFRENAIF